MNLLHFSSYILFDQFVYLFIIYFIHSVNLCEAEKMYWLQDKAKTRKKSNIQVAINKQMN